MTVRRKQYSNKEAVNKNETVRQKETARRKRSSISAM
jgi:hypothetical protein